MPSGPLNVAAMPVPLAEPNMPADPASVDTTPVAITILRMVWLPYSATYKLEPSVVMPAGW